MRHAIEVGKVVEEGEENGEGLLHAHEAIERPFAVVLYDRINYWRSMRKTPGRDYVLAGVVAFGWAAP